MLHAGAMLCFAAFGASPPFALAGGTWIFVGFVVAFFFALVFGYYTIKGSGISQRPFRRGGGPPESPSEAAHDITQDVRNWERGTAGHHGDRHRPPATRRPVDPAVASALAEWRASTRAPQLDPPISSTDRIEGPEGAPIILLYVDMASEPCRSACQLVGELVAQHRARIAVRHLPLADVHPLALPAADALEAAAAQGQFFAALDRLAGGRFADEADLLDVAALSVPEGERLKAEVRSGRYREKVVQDIRTAITSGARVVPEVFINGEHYQGELKRDPLGAALKA
jgi:protein-disulfide isomerase